MRHAIVFTFVCWLAACNGTAEGTAPAEPQGQTATSAAAEPQEAASETVSTTPVSAAGSSDPAPAESVASAGRAAVSGDPSPTAGTPAQDDAAQSSSAGHAAAMSNAAAGTSAAMSGSAGDTAPSAGAPAAGNSATSTAETFTLTPVDFPMAGDELTFPQTANPPTNESPEFTWTGVPAAARSLALAFRDLGNGAVKWVIWDIPPTQTHLPPNISHVAMPPEVPGSSQLGSLNNQGYAGPGSGARQYDFTLWALDVEHLPLTGRETTVEIHDELLSMHETAKTAPVLVRNTRNLP